MPLHVRTRLVPISFLCKDHLLDGVMIQCMILLHHFENLPVGELLERCPPTCMYLPFILFHGMMRTNVKSCPGACEIIVLSRQSSITDHRHSWNWRTMFHYHEYNVPFLRIHPSAPRQSHPASGAALETPSTHLLLPRTPSSLL